MADPVAGLPLGMMLAGRRWGPHHRYPRDFQHMALLLHLRKLLSRSGSGWTILDRLFPALYCFWTYSCIWPPDPGHVPVLVLWLEGRDPRLSSGR